ncbi:DUF6551 family protein [Streptomyces sp. NBC_00258]|uniref:DUF6551 family protein n=1 Tax=Streptomyces sp. NBC_00258 TaxID=2903642 RepID=UPI002E280199|nr:DUF6551 family protein [Streptomyces sp. NBC_00258]
MIDVHPHKKIEMVAPENVTTDPRVNTRPVDRSWVARKIREGYDVKRIGVPTVSARGDGTFVWLDGQNRGALCVAAGSGATKISMMVFRSLTLAEEAELFLGLNDNRRVAPIYKFLAEVTAGRKEALEITRIAGQFGWTVSDAGGPSNIAAVAALNSIFRSTKPGGATLRATLKIVTQAWGHTPDSVNAHLLLGLASVLNEAPHLIPASMIKKLAHHDGGPAGILRKGRGFRSATGCTVTQGVDQVIRAIYNSGRRSGRLATWGPPAPRSAGQEQMAARV